MADKCCDRWRPRYGCPEEICPGCFCPKGHDQNVCDECHAYNMREPHPPYIAKYGPANERKVA